MIGQGMSGLTSVAAASFGGTDVTGNKLPKKVKKP